MKPFFLRHKRTIAHIIIMLGFVGISVVGDAFVFMAFEGDGNSTWMIFPGSVIWSFGFVMLKENRKDYKKAKRLDLIDHLRREYQRNSNDIILRLLHYEETRILDKDQ